MYISELELHGFKSFAHKTHVKFDSGITAIVGPNGCGKSNIVDALRWVLGEQRPTLLRSSSMSNVIFNGTSKKKALGMAAVSLTFINDQGILPVEYSELTITRRLYRSGDSEYLINDTACRLKDIMELFMDTGMSSDAYSVIELKMVEEILNDRNNDRRRLFEEAAGVTRYKEKRKQTLRKLDSTLKDLQRLEDILVEVRKKTRSLEKQAEKAAQAKTFKKELEQLDKAFTLSQYSQIHEELNPLKERITNAEREKKQIAKKLEELESKEEEARKKLIEKERNEAEARKRSGRLHSAIRDLETGLKISKEKIVNEKGVIKQYESDIKQSKKDLDELQKLREISIQKLENFSDQKEQSEQTLKDSKDRFSEVQQEYTKVRHELYELEIEISDCNQKLTQLQSNRIKLESKLESSEDDRLRIDRDIEDFEDEIFNAKGELNLAKKKLNTANKETEKQEAELQKASARKSEIEDQREELREDIRSQKSKKDAVVSEIKLLKNIAESNDATPGSVSYLIENHAEAFSTLEPIGNLLQTSEKYAAALEAALGEAINYVVVDSMKEAVLASKILKEQDKGRATFIPRKELSKSYTVQKNTICHQTNTPTEFANIAQLLLGDIIVEENVSDAGDYLKENGSSVVTLDGDLITSSGFYKSGSKNKQSGIRLGLKDKLEKLNKRLKEIEKELEEEIGTLEQINKELSSIKIDKIRKKIRELQQESQQFEQKISRYQSSIQVYEKNISELNSRKQSLAGNLDAAREQLDDLHPKQKEFQKKISDLNSKQEEKKETLQKLEDERAIAQNRYNDAQLKHQDVKNKAENLNRDVERAESGIKNIQERLETRTNLLKESREKIEAFKKDIDQTEKKLTENREHKKSADENLSNAEEASAQQRGTINEIEKELKELRRQKEVNLELVHHLSMAREKFEIKAQGLSDHIWETYGILMEQVDETMPEEMDADSAKERIGYLKQKLNKIGDVNPLAIDEFKEEKERLDFYEEQIEDLNQAEKELRETIDEINETATKRFNETFTKIRENFKTVFGTLFHEGDFCDLIIEEDVEDPLEAKIDIKANPKGKRPSSINQLSGGEKTLTAIALLFAIYLVKPSPFCVLDEVDAPLDDANIERFSQMIRTFSEETQFIIITHNKKTMSKAEMMYGVTMPETGVSRLVGVKLDEVAEA